MASRPPLKILYHHRTMSGDGQAVHISAMVRALRDIGHQVELVGPSAARTAGDDRPTMSARLRAALPKGLSERLERLYSRWAEVALRKAVKRFQPDILYERHSLFMDAGLRAARAAALPYLLEVNAPLTDERSNHGGLVLERLARRIETRVWRAADHVLPVSGTLADILAATGVPRARMTVIPNGVWESDVTPPRKPGPQGATEVTLGFVGFVRDWHRLDRVTAVMAQPDCQHVRLKIIGDGPALPALMEGACQVGVDNRIEVTGVLPQDAIPEALQNVDIGLLPAVTSYASPLKLFDYMAAGTAVLAPGQDNIRELVVDGESAKLFEPGNDEAWQTALTALISNAALRERLALGAHNRLRESAYYWSANARRVSEIAHKLLEQDGGAPNQPDAI